MIKSLSIDWIKTISLNHVYIWVLFFLWAKFGEHFLEYGGWANSRNILFSKYTSLKRQFSHYLLESTLLWSGITWQNELKQKQPLRKMQQWLQSFYKKMFLHAMLYLLKLLVIGEKISQMKWLNIYRMNSWSFTKSQLPITLKPMDELRAQVRFFAQFWQRLSTKKSPDSEMKLHSVFWTYNVAYKMECGTMLFNMVFAKPRMRLFHSVCIYLLPIACKVHLVICFQLQ